MKKLISYAYMREECDIPDNITDEVLDNKIKDAQIVLRNLLTDDFYNELVSQYPNSLSTDNRALHDPYIKQFIAHQAYEYYVVKSTVSETKSGFRVHTEENSVIAPDKQMAELIRLAKEKASMFKGFMITYILNAKKADTSKYPLYDVGCHNKGFGNGFHVTVAKRKDPIYNRINYEKYGGY